MQYKIYEANLITKFSMKIDENKWAIFTEWWTLLWISFQKQKHGNAIRAQLFFWRFGENFPWYSFN